MTDTNKLPPCPFNEDQGTSEEAWTDGLDLILDELKYDEEIPFNDPEEIWEEVGYMLDDEEVKLSEAQKSAIRKIFDNLWPNYKGK